MAVRAACRPPPCGRGWTGASADGIDFPTLVQRAGIAFASLTRFAEGVGRGVSCRVKASCAIARFIAYRLMELSLSIQRPMFWDTVIVLGYGVY